MNIKDPLIEWYIHSFHRPVGRARCASMIQTTRLVHHVFIERRGDLARRPIVHRLHRPNHRTEPSKLHRGREMDNLVWTLFISYSRMTCREIRKLGVLEIAPDDALDCKLSVVESERRLEWLFPIWETMTRKADPFILAKLFDDPRNARFLSIYMRECGEGIDAPTNVDQFRTDGKEVGLASGFGLTDGNEMWLFTCGSGRIAPSGTNEGGQGWGVGRDVVIREILLALPIGTSSVQGQLGKTI